MATADYTSTVEANAMQQLSRAGRVVAGDAQRLKGSATRLADTATTQVRDALIASPYAAVGVAAGIGFVLAGGLTSPLARTAFRIGSRIAVSRAMAAFAAPQRAAAATPQEPTQGADHGSQSTHEG
ncbi:MAG: hypothetical protein R3F39_18205 [Myxococcota bacterium]